MDLHALTATRMRELLDRREVSSVDLARAHLDRIEARDPELHCFTHVFRDGALEAAREADARRARGESRGLLDGLPITVKESLDIQGAASTMGVPSRKSHRAKEDAAVVRLLKEGGAVILGRTNVSQYLIYHESRNPLFGQAANPWDLGRTPGGSSGGEASAIAAGLSSLGVGTDIGGSIRVPAHFCGIAGLKPTLDRWTNRGSNTSMAGQEAIRGQCGPMARSTADVVLAMRALDPSRMSALDGRTPPLPFEDPARIDVKGLRVGVFDDDGLVPSSLAVARGVRRAADALRARGCEIVSFVPPHVADNVYLYFAAMSSDGGAILRRGLEGGEVDPVIKGLQRVADLPSPVRAAAARIAGLAGQQRIARLLSVIGQKTVDEFWGITTKIRAYRFELTEALDRARVDVVLCPPHATPALPHLGARDFALAGSPSMLWNLVQFPAGVVPVTRVRPDEARRDHPRDRLETLAARVDERSTGLPVGVQVVARPWREDLVLAAMQAIEDEVRKDADFPATPV